MLSFAPYEQSAAICSCCKLLKAYPVEWKNWGGQLTDLARAGQDGCPRCGFFAKCFASFAPEIFSLGNSFHISYTSIGLKLQRYRDRQSVSLSLDVFLLSAEVHRPPPLHRGLPTRSLLPGQTSSNTTFRTIQHWTSTCVNNHTRCNATGLLDAHSTQFPKRIIQVTSDQVILREHLSHRPQYACLSHCWGPSTNITKTTSASLELFKNEIPSDSLTPNFQHAVDVCRRLGIEFLWIDSLCIIQDSETDWKEESAKMASIYENAFLTIASTKSAAGSGGCYAVTDPEYLAKPVPGTNVYVRQRPPLFPAGWLNYRYREAQAWPLLNRGWAYQEIRLSRRILHFCNQEVIWECRESRKSESGCSDKDIGTDDPQFKSKNYFDVPYWILERDPQKLWYRTVEEYSDMQLTFEKDKMPALAALTQKMETLRVNDRFLAGLWEKTLLFDLLWMVFPSPKTGRSATWLAPTWSWASVQSRVVWESEFESIRILDSVRVITIRYSTKGPSHLAEIEEAALTLRAPLLRGTVEENKLLLPPTMPFVDDINSIHYLHDLFHSTTEEHHNHSGIEVSVLIIGICDSGFDRSYEGIVLLSKGNTTLYERIGHVYLSIKPSELAPEDFDRSEARNKEARRKEARRMEARRNKIWEEMTGVITSTWTNLFLEEVTIV